MPRNPATDWLTLAHDSYWLWTEAMMVIGMRSTDILLRRPGHEREAVRMVTEKLQAHSELATHLATAGPMAPEKAMHKAVKHYRKRVSANRRRLAQRTS